MPLKNKDLQRSYQRGWLTGRKSFFLEGMKCAKCKSDGTLEFDHRDPKNKWKHSFWSYKKETILRELKKCQLLCKKCHMKKTDADYKRSGHSLAGYKKGCRCVICKNKKRIAMYNYRKRRSHSLVVKHSPVTQVSRVRSSVAPPRRIDEIQSRR